MNYRLLPCLALLCVAWTACAPLEAADSRPNIVFILADDMGYGDPHCFNPQSKIPTPHIDRLAIEGMRFTDAHAAGAVCVPRATGCLPADTHFEHRREKPDQRALIEPGRPTIATVLHDRGYVTGMIGKWHLGFEGGDRFDRSGPCAAVRLTTDSIPSSASMRRWTSRHTFSSIRSAASRSPRARSVRAVRLTGRLSKAPSGGRE